MPIQLSFADLHDAEDVATALTIDVEFVQWLATPAKSTAYQAMQLRKKGRRGRGRYRTVYKVTDGKLRLAQKLLAVGVTTARVPHPDAFGFAPRRSAVEGARRHSGARVLLRMDIEKFFESTSAAAVQSALARLGTPPGGASALADITTFADALPPGAHSSPALADLILEPVDLGLAALASECGARYSRYADDLTFSGDQVPEVSDVASVLSQYGYTVAAAKTRWQYRGRAQFVTGLSVSDPQQPRVPRRLKHWLRCFLHALDRYGPEAVIDRSVVDLERKRVDGALAYINAVEPETAARMVRRWQSALCSLDLEHWLVVTGLERT